MADDHSALWKRYAVRGVELDMPMKQLKGFTCPAKLNYPIECYQIVDARCKGGNCTAANPTGSGFITKLNHMEADLDLVVVYLTDTDEHRVYQIQYFFGPRQPLAKDTNLGKALIAKYGQPMTIVNEVDAHDPLGGGRIQWRATEDYKGPEVDADCLPVYNASNPDVAAGKQCKIYVKDDDILGAEREKQKDIDLKHVKSNQPPPPTL